MSVARPIFNVYRQTMAAWKRSVLRAALLLAAAGALVYSSLFLMVRSARFQRWLKAEIANRTDYEFNAGHLTLVPPLRLVASAAAISKSSKTLLQSEEITVTLSPIGLLSKSIYRLELMKPILSLDLHELFAPSSKISVDIAIGHLKIVNGTLVLTPGEAESVDFRSINLEAENLNAGQTTGLHLRTDLPWLNGTADIAIRSQNDEKTVAVRIQQTSVKQPGFLSATKNQSEAFQAEMTILKKETAELEIHATGRLDQLGIGEGHWSGPFNVNAGVDAAFKQVIFSGKMVAPHLPTNIGAVPLVPNKTPVTASFTGSYSIPERQMALKSVRLESSSWTAEGDGNVNFSHQLNVSNARFALRNIAVEAFKPLLPEWLRAWTYSGTTEADVQFEGAWPALAIHGVARSDGTQFRSRNFSLAQLSLRAPFQWDNGSLLVRDLQLTGKSLAIDRKDEIKISAEEIL